MRHLETDVAIVGAGAAGLCAAIEASRSNAKVMVFDENKLPGGQLFKQIHKFFGSKEHLAGVRGYEIGTQLLRDVEDSGVEVMLDSVVYALENGTALGVVQGDRHYAVKARKVIIAAGAKENYMNFPGSTLPGVMGAGAAQTMINVNRVLPGERVLMVGSGNVGLIVAYQLLQAGASVAGIVEGAPVIGGYGVHAGKIRRAGVPILVSHTIKEAYGKEQVEGVVIAALDEKWQMLPGSEKNLKVDTICLAVGLNPMTELLWMAGVGFTFIPVLGGHVPMHDEDMQTTNPDIYVAGDITGVEEASSAMEEGKLAGIAATEALGLIPPDEAKRRKAQVVDRLETLRTGMFGEKRRTAKAAQVDAMAEFRVNGGAH